MFSVYNTLSFHTFSISEFLEFFRCKVCDKAFSQSGPLQVHLKIHDGVKPHLCDICGKKFRHKCNLVHHKDRHHDIKKFKCGERGCTMGFCSKSESPYVYMYHQSTQFNRAVIKCSTTSIL